ncbi:MAG TPA: Holliday junction resolvase RuvX [Acidimicrobiales bacterium]|nr:Holliday junction resolvase RuvX [Acidimicrobiales bacterium]
MKPAGRVLGLDLGSRRIGVAVTDAARTVATGVTAIHRGADRVADHAAIAALAAEYDAVGVVVGVPLSLSSGREGPAARLILEEVDQLRSGLGLDVDTIDERLTTIAASSVLRAAGRSARRQKDVVDQTAAALLLQTWIDRQTSLKRDDR